MTASSAKLEYDSTQGGAFTLANHVSTYRYAAGALTEMRSLLDEIRHPSSTKLVFQTLPKHMRRRAMSHHPKRLPRKYRAAHKSQMAKAGKPQQTKMPSRKHRRRPGNLLNDYLRRQRRNAWLETHIWHAKRFHMIDRWGYRLPYASCDKTYRACYRATSEHCLLQDISFYACIEMQGKLSELQKGFERLSSRECGLGICARTYLSGLREGHIELFKDGQYPLGALDKVSFMWQPSEALAACKTLWLWIHPAAYRAIFEQLIKVFELLAIEKQASLANEANSDLIKASQTRPKTTAKRQRRLQFMLNSTAQLSQGCYHNAETGIKLKELKGSFNRFRLSGPLAQAVLSQALQPKMQPSANEWLSRLDQNNHQKQADYWQKCSELSSPAELMSNIVLALNIEDPRLHRPQKRSKAKWAQPQHGTPEFVADLPCQSLSQSMLWQAEMRHEIAQNIMSTHEYCSLRAKHAIVPGDACQFEQQLQAVPLLLVQRPGSQQANYKRLGYGCGWDVIAPAGYGMTLWMSLIMWGARPGGLREFENLAREMAGDLHLPDTMLGLTQAAEQHQQLVAKYFRLPNNKRCNYRKLAIVSPFKVPYAQLVRDWLPAANVEAMTDKPIFYILRCRQLLQQLQQHLQCAKKFSFPELPNNCLIQLHFRMKSRGNPDNFSMVCLPTRADFKRNLKQIKHENHEPVYTEPLLPDLYEQQRKQARLQHKKLLKRLRAKRVREKRKLQETSNKRVYIRAADTADLCREQFVKMCKLWLPEDCSSLFSVRKQASREVFGYLSVAHFSYTEAAVCGIGYVTVEGLKQLLQLCRQVNIKQPMCLIRGTSTRHYRFASFKLNLNP